MVVLKEYHTRCCITFVRQNLNIKTCRQKYYKASAGIFCKLVFISSFHAAKITNGNFWYDFFSYLEHILCMRNPDILAQLLPTKGRLIAVTTTLDWHFSLFLFLLEYPWRRNNIKKSHTMYKWVKTINCNYISTIYLSIESK